MGMRSKTKGKVGEREAAAALNEVLGTDCRRGVQYQGGADSPDVIGLPGVHVEVKRVEALNIRKAFEQSAHDAAVGKVPVVLHRQNRAPWLMTCRLTDLPALARSAGRLRQRTRKQPLKNEIAGNGVRISQDAPLRQSDKDKA